MKMLKKLEWISLAISVVMLLLGLCLLIWPNISATVLCYVMSAILLAVGVFRIVCYVQRGISSIFHVYELPLGILDVLMGVYGFARSQSVVLILPVIIGILILVDSLFQLQASIDLRRLSVPGWGLSLVLSILSVAFALLLVMNPFEGSRTLMIFIGLSMMVDGVQILSYIICASKCVKEVKKLEAMDTDYEIID